MKREETNMNLESFKKYYLQLDEGADLSSDSDKTSYLKDEDYKLNEETKPKIIYVDEVAELKRDKRQQ